jgi:hypothetical protein
MEHIPFLPPFNMDHDIIDDVDIAEAKDVDFEDYEDPDDYDPDLDMAPDEQLLDDATDIAARVLPEIPVVEYYIHEDPEPRFDTNFLEEKFTVVAGEELWQWINIETMPWDYTEFVLPEIQDVAGSNGDYILVSSWLTEDSTQIWEGNPNPEGNAIRMKFTYDATDGTGIYVNRHGMECVGDVTGDGVVNMDDVWPLVNRWNLADGECQGGVCYEALYDLNNDGIIDLADIMIVVSNWGPCE